MKIEVKQHGLEAEIIETETFNTQEIFKALTEKDDYGNRKQEYIMIGDNIYSTISIQSVKKIEETAD